MSGPIQLIPPGFLGFMQLKNDGRNPQVLVDGIAPTFDMLEWYFQSRAEFLTSGLVAVANGSQSFIPLTGGSGSNLIVPEKEWWWVENLTARLDTLAAAADVVEWQLGYRVSGATNSLVICGPNQRLVGSATLFPMPHARTDKGGFFAPPGAELGMFFSQFSVGAGGNAEGWARFVRLPA